MLIVAPRRRLTAAERENPYPRHVKVDRDDGALIEIVPSGFQYLTDALPDSLRQDIAGPDLHHARSTSLRRREDRAEIQVAGKDDGLVIRSPGQDLGVCGIEGADLRPVLCVMTVDSQSTRPRRG